MQSFAQAALALPILGGFVVGGRAAAQTAPVQQQSLAYPWDSGARDNATDSEQVVASHTIAAAGASWMRLRFQLVQLWNDGDDSTGAFLRVTSHLDGSVQELHALEARQWQMTTAYFNGDAVQVDLVAPPAAGPSRLILRSVWIGPPTPIQNAQCGLTDDRVLSQDPRCARLLPVGCTGFLIDDSMHCMVSAGHCEDPSSPPPPDLRISVAQFRVPSSTASGTIRHPRPEHQYAVDGASKQKQSTGLGADWIYFGCFPNTNTGLLPAQGQGAFFRLAPPPPVSPGHVLRVTGYGEDATTASETFVQQSATGPFVGLTGATLDHQVDTTNGSSGSPVIWDNGAGEVIAVHAQGGCSTLPPIGANHATSTTNVLWQNALANPAGICAPAPSATSYCTAKVNSLGCAPAIGATGSPSASGGPGSFAIQVSSVLNQTQGLVFYGYLPSARPFQGGFKCVDAPTVRTDVQATGGLMGPGSSCTGSFAYDMGARIASGIDPNLALGAIVYAQAWSRDPADPFASSLTDALRFTIGP
jgi:V8-like Glu-specific endopeptidase